ncbi:MAG TPA: FecR domain-containing protein [Chloroflexota bacterium]|nr:FecR domain-containing protein [Chloroflexota bacterium]
MAGTPPPDRPHPRALTASDAGPPAFGATIATTFPPAEARAARTPEQAQRLAWRVLLGAFAIWLGLAGGGVYALTAWLRTATVPAAANLQIDQGVVLLQERGAGPPLSARAGMAMQEGDALEVTEGALARLELPGQGVVRLGPRARLVLAKLRAGRFAPAAGVLAFQHIAGALRVEVAPAAAQPLGLETPYGTVTMNAGDYVVQIDGPRAQVLVRQGAATVSVGANPPLALAAGERAQLAANAAASGPYPGGANLITNGDFAADLAGWQARDTQEPNRPDRLGVRTIEQEPLDGVPHAALRVSRQSRFQTHNETGLVQPLNADVSVYPRLVLSARVKVRSASLSGGGYLDTEYPLMFRLRYRDAAGNGQTWYRGFYYQNPERRPADHGELVPENTWVRFQLDLAQLPEPPVFLYALEVLGAGHDFDALVTDIQLTPQ